MNIDAYKNKGYVGLCNLGNTCFLNACVQILNHTYELVELMKSNKIQKYAATKMIPDTTILSTWTELCTMMWDCDDPCAVSPKKFVYEVHQIAKKKGRELFTGWGQNDMTEFLLFMVECMHNSISRSIDVVIRGNPIHKKDENAIRCYEMLKTVYGKEYSEIMDMFYGIYMSDIISMDNTRVYSSKPEHFFMLDLPIPSHSTPTTLMDCFQAFVESEYMMGENAWFNESTGRREDVQKKITFWNFPKILVIVLKRFSPDGTRKINTLVDFPLHTLDLSHYVNGYYPEQYVYRLYGVCNHIGSVMGGHYTAFVRNASAEWIHYNDTGVSRIQEEDVITPMAYCLFYQR